MDRLEALLRRTLWPGGRSGLMVRSAQGLVFAKFVAMALGFAFWVAAARLFPAEVVGLTSGVIAAALLIVQLSLFGVDGALVLVYPQRQRSAGRLFAAAAAIVTATAAFWSIVFLLFARGVMDELGRAASDPVFAVVFVIMAVVGTVSALLDRGSMARRRGNEVLVRSAINGTVTVLPLGLVPLIDSSFDSRDLFAFWVGGTATAVAVGAMQLRSNELRAIVPGPSTASLVGALMRNGPRYYALALAERAPAVALPVVVTEIVSPTAMAHWYPVWMMAWGVFVIPASHGVALFAEGAHHPAEIRAAMSKSIRSTLVTGYLIAMAVALGGWPLLYLLGPDYAQNGIVPLLFLLLAVGPLSFSAVYYSTCRATGRIREALLTSLFAGTVSVGAAAIGASWAGLIGLSAGWTVAQAAIGVWTYRRSTRLITSQASRPVADRNTRSRVLVELSD